MTATLPSRSPSGNPTVYRQNLLRLHELLVEKQRRVQLQDRRQRLSEDLGAFFREAWSVLEPGRSLTWSWHYDLIAEYLWLVREGKFKARFNNAIGLITNVSPRSSKSSFLSVCFPAWVWSKYPTWRFLCASYSGELSIEHSVKRRDLIQSAWYQELWGDRFRLKSDQNVKHHFDNDHTGSMTATSVGGAAIGRGGDCLLLDDPISASQALSDTERKTANEWIDHTFRSRINDPASGVILMIMQRLHEMDPTGFVLAQEPERWVHLSLALEAEDREVWRFPVSGREVVRDPGSVLMPERFSPDTVAGLKQRRIVFATQHQQRPVPLEGNMIRRADARWYGGVASDGAVDEPRPERFDLVVISADCAFKDLATSDFVAVSAIGVKEPRRYVLNVSNKHMDLDATEAEILRQRTEYGASAVLVEDKANGSAVIQHLRRKIPGVIAIEPEGGKVGRMFAMSPEWQAGNWYLDRTAAWSDMALDQLMKFPNAAHDDICDSLSQVSGWLHQTKSIYRDALSDGVFYRDADRPITLRNQNGHVEHWVSIKYGTSTPCVFLEIYDDGETVWWDREWYYDSRASWQQKTDSKYADDLQEFINSGTVDRRLWPGMIIDAEAADSLKRELVQRGLYVIDAKNDVMSGIRRVASMLMRKKIRINKDGCPRTSEEMQTYSWDEGPEGRGNEKPLNVNCSGPDAGRYHCETRINDWRIAA